MSKKPKYDPPEMINPLYFTQSDLDANRAGTLSKNQRAKLQYKCRRTLRHAGFTVLIGGTAVLLFSSASGLLWIIVLASIVLSGTYIYQWWQAAGDLKDGTVTQVSGHVMLDVHPGRYDTYYSVTVAGQRFNVSKEIFLAFKNGDPYTLYYTPISRTLLSVDTLS